MSKFLKFISLLLFLCLFGKLAFADQNEWMSLHDANKQLTQWQKELQNWQKKTPSLDVLMQRQGLVSNLRQQSILCVKTISEKLVELNTHLEALGEQQKGEVDSVKKFRSELMQTQKQLENQSNVCQVTNLAAQKLLANLKLLRGTLVSRTLGHREPSIWHKFIELSGIDNWFHTPLTNFQLWPAWLVGLISLVTLYPLASYVSRLLRRHYSIVKSENAANLILYMLAQRIPWIAVFISLMLFTYFADNTVISALLLAVCLSLLLAPLLEVLLCQRVQKCTAGLPARILLDLVLVGFSLYWVGIVSILHSTVLDILYGLYLLAILLTAIWFVFAISKQQYTSSLSALRLPLIALLAIGPGAFWFGYHALANLLVIGLYGSLAGLAFIVLLYRLYNHLLNRLEDHTSPSGNQLRLLLGYQAEEKITGLWFARLLFILSSISFFVYWLLLVWQVPKTDITALLAYFFEGFEVGATTIVPSKILAGIATFFLLWIFTRWLRKKLDECWLIHSSLDKGAQQSIIALTTYLIIGVGILVSLNMTGIDLQNLAIVAGALSVGIGFGLQNIVNNFVSGLILLFERPVKPGDWVVVGATEGHIKKISIRYTQIQTFDGADVLVPNSELISSPVINKMLHNNLGRVVTKVGVAYGTDTRKVSEILNQIAREHPFVLVKDPRVPAPQVCFMGFGDSSLDFELRCYIKDVGYSLSVRSDLLFAIDDAFRKENIEIPFPQRVVHYANTLT